MEFNDDSSPIVSDDPEPDDTKCEVSESTIVDSTLVGTAKVFHKVLEYSEEVKVLDRSVVEVVLSLSNECTSEGTERSSVDAPVKEMILSEVTIASEKVVVLDSDVVSRKLFDTVEDTFSHKGEPKMEELVGYNEGSEDSVVDRSNTNISIEL